MVVIVGQNVFLWWKCYLWRGNLDSIWHIAICDYDIIKALQTPEVMAIANLQECIILGVSE